MDRRCVIPRKDRTPPAERYIHYAAYRDSPEAIRISQESYLPRNVSSNGNALILRFWNLAKTATTRFDVAEHLRTPEEMAAYLEACLEEADGDAAFVAKALGDIARAKGMSQVARDSGLSRESLYKALSGERSPGFDTILKVAKALGLRLRAEAVPGEA